MKYKVYLRPLVIEDAQISYQWRNNPKIWRFTGSRPNRHITAEMETAWLVSVLQRENEKRFAICLCEDDRYIGNIYITDISREPQIHIFIGDIQFWGKNRALEAGWQALHYAFYNLQLDSIFMEMHANNPGMGRVIKIGWKPVAKQENGFVKHVYTKATFEQMNEHIHALLKD
jgi:RimJ/RimL family protein N-acetyltransferase